MFDIFCGKIHLVQLVQPPAAADGDLGGGRLGRGEVGEGHGGLLPALLRRVVVALRRGVVVVPAARAHVDLLPGRARVVVNVLVRVLLVVCVRVRGASHAVHVVDLEARGDSERSC